MGEGRVGFTIVTHVQQGMSLEVLATLCRSSLEDSSPISLTPQETQTVVSLQVEGLGRNLPKGAVG